MSGLVSDHPQNFKDIETAYILIFNISPHFKFVPQLSKRRQIFNPFVRPNFRHTGSNNVGLFLGIPRHGSRFSIGIDRISRKCSISSWFFIIKTIRYSFNIQEILLYVAYHFLAQQIYNRIYCKNFPKFVFLLLN